MSEWLKEEDCKSSGSAYVGSNPTLPISILLSSAVERLTVNQFVPGSIPGGGVMYRTTYKEQFSYIYMCFKEIALMLILKDRYRPGV